MESRKIFSAVLSALLMTGAFTGCGSAKKEESDDEETSAQTLTVSDPDYYTRFKGKGISINVYNLFIRAHLPVEPNPPSPRAVSGRSATSSNSMGR